MPLEIPLLIALAPAILLLIQAALAPVETLLWTAGWTRDEHGHTVIDATCTPAGNPPLPATPPRAYLVYLDGVGKTAPRDTRVARTLIAELGPALPDVALVTHVMPYAATNRPLHSRPVAGRYWRFLARHHLRLLLFVNNALQVLVACDPRYREPYGRGVAHTLIAHLLDAGYQPGSHTPLILLTYSGGMQAGAATTTHLAHALGYPPLTLIGIGGFHDGAADLRHVRAIHTLTSRHDVIEHAARAFPARWREQWQIPGRFHRHDLTPARHFGPRCYLSETVISPGESPQTYLNRTVDTLTGIVRASTVAPRSTHAAGGEQ